MHTVRFQPLARLRGSQFFSVFNGGDELARGRCFLLASSITANIAATLFGGTFYSGFLLANGIDLVQIGVISFIPNLCVLFSLLSPPFLAKLAKRKSFLLTLHAVYYFLLIVAITVLPYLNLSKEWTIGLLALFLLIAHGCNAFSNAGWFVWHKKLIPEPVRATYFSYSLAIIGVMNSVVQILGAVLADALKAGGDELTGMVIVRLSGLLFAAIDMICLACIKEYPYEAVTSHTRIRDVFLLPFKHKKYLGTVVLKMTWNLISGLVTSFVSVFLLQSVGISYTYIYVMTALYGVFLIVFTPVWKRIIQRTNMFTGLALSLLTYAPGYFLYALLTPDNCVWLYPVIICLHHWSGVGYNLAIAEMPYVNMPSDHEECYASFHVVGVNMMAFFGLMLGTLFVDLIGDGAVVIGSMQFTAIPILLVVTSVLLLIYALVAQIAAPHLIAPKHSGQ